MFSLSEAFRRFKKKRRVRRAIEEIHARMERGMPSIPHGLDRPLVVSLTSYERRFPTLALTLNAILHQSMRPDRVILWLTKEDRLALPDEIRAMEGRGLEIASTENTRSYKKIIPTLRAYPDSYILTFDDDAYYGPRAIEQLVAARQHNPAGIVCHRAHLIHLNADGTPAPYATWGRDIPPRSPSGLAFPTGVMGVLYPPGAFHDDVTNAAIFTELCPTMDDVWLYWMWRLRGLQASQTGRRPPVIEWPDAQATALRLENLGNELNDRAISAMIKRYGFPRG